MEIGYGQCNELNNVLFIVVTKMSKKNQITSQFIFLQPRVTGGMALWRNCGRNRSNFEQTQAHTRLLIHGKEGQNPLLHLFVTQSTKTRTHNHHSIVMSINQGSHLRVGLRVAVRTPTPHAAPQSPLEGANNSAQNHHEE